MKTKEEYFAKGSIEGVLMPSQSSDNNFFYIRDLLTNKIASGRLNTDYLIAGLWGKRVIVSGLVTYNCKGEKLSIQANAIELLPPENELPSP
jgi:hypothetical protein